MITNLIEKIKTTTSKTKARAASAEPEVLKRIKICPKQDVFESQFNFKTPSTSFLIPETTPLPQSLKLILQSSYNLVEKSRKPLLLPIEMSEIDRFWNISSHNMITYILKKSISLN